MAGQGKAVKKGKKNRKHGRNKRSPSDKVYTSQQRWIKNKANKLARHMKNHPNDLQSVTEGVIVNYTSKYESCYLDKKLGYTGGKIKK